MRLSARSSLPRSAHLALHEAKTSFSSRGNMLKREIQQGQETKTYGKLLDRTLLRIEKVFMKPFLNGLIIQLVWDPQREAWHRELLHN